MQLRVGGGLGFVLFALLSACGGGAPPEAPLDSQETPLAADCVGLVPTSRGPRYTDTFQMTPGGVCLGGMSDENHRIAVGWRSAAGQSTWRLHEQDGSTVRTFGAAGVTQLFGQDLGFIGPVELGTSEGLQSWDHSGLPSGNSTYASDATSSDRRQFVSVDDAGGALVVLAARGADGTYRLTAQRFDSHSQPRSGPALLATSAAPPQWLVGAVNDSGKTLVVFDGAMAGYAADHAAAQWMDRIGTPLTPLFDAGAVPQPVTQVDLRGLSGGHLALQLSRQWVLKFPKYVATAQPPPAFLTANNGRKLRQINDYRGYAFFPFAGESLAECVQRVEIWSPSGAHCGHLDFPASSGACVTGDIDLGACEGTVIQDYPPAKESCTSAGCTCTHRYYPHVFPELE